MNKDISNKTLAWMFIIGVLVVFIGMIISIGGPYMSLKFITGKQTVEGVARINITEKIEIELLKNSVNFGNGYRNQSFSSDSECNLSSYDTTNPDCWINLTHYPPENFSHFQLENAGNVYVNVTINSSNATDFFGTPITGGTPRYIWRGIHTVGDDGCPGADLVTDFVSFNNEEQQICARFLNEDQYDMFNISINLSIPSGPVGKKSKTVMFIGRKTD